MMNCENCKYCNLDGLSYPYANCTADTKLQRIRLDDPSECTSFIERAGLCSSYTCQNGKTICCAGCKDLEKCKTNVEACKWTSLHNECPDYNKSESD